MRPFIGKQAGRGTVIQATPEFCPACDGRQLVKRGLRKNHYRRLQIYWCRDCRKYFCPLAGLKGVKYPPPVIARALSLYNLGLTQKEVARRLVAENRITVPPRTISDWIAGYRSVTTFHRLRPRAIQQFGPEMLTGRTLEHNQLYEFHLHLAKLAFMGDAVAEDIATTIRAYLFSVLDDFPDHLFRTNVTALHGDDAEPGRSDVPSEPLRSSRSCFETLPFECLEKQNLANDLAAMGLLLARTNKDRHPAVQDFMLANDSSTIACEVPVYVTADEIRQYKAQGLFVSLPELPAPITGHIDVLQARNGLIHILDYKPKARQVNPVHQLIVYALALAARTRLPLKVFKCAWFDEKDWFEFFPLKAVFPVRTPSRVA